MVGVRRGVGGCWVFKLVSGALSPVCVDRWWLAMK